MKNNVLIPVITLLVGLGAGFYGGLMYQRSKIPAFGQIGNRAGNRPGGNGQFFRSGGTSPGQDGNRAGFRPVAGTILSVGKGTMTVKVNDGSSRIVVLPGSAQINKAAPATITDLTAGETVMVVGQENSDGSVTAQTVQLNPVGRGVAPASPQPKQ